MLTIAGLLMVAVLPSPRATVKKNADSVDKMNKVLTALRQYQAATCSLPCPADPTLPMGDNNWGKAAANPGAGSPGDCIGGTPAAAYADTTKHIAIGMVPVFTIGLSADSAFDGWGKDITYAVDTNATPVNWSSLALPGAITVNDNGIAQNSVLALVSHGQDGYGAWLPLQGASGTALRLDSGSIDTNQADNAQVTHGGGLTANGAGQFASFINRSQNATFDDQVVYRSTQWNVNAVPRMDQTIISPPANGTYSAPQILTFTVTSPQVLTVTGTPQLDLSALSGGSIGTGNKAHATYSSGSGSNTLTFTYQVQSSDNAPNGLVLTTPVDLNGGNISPCLPFNAPDLSKVVINSQYIWIAEYYSNDIREIDSGGNWVKGFGAGYNGVSGTIGSSGKSDYKFNMPTGVIVDSSGNFWVADTGNSRVMKFNSSGQWLMTIGGTTSQACSGTYVNATTCANLAGHTACCAPNATSCTCSYGSSNGQFNWANGGGGGAQLALDNSGNLWVTDSWNGRIQEFNSTTGAYMNNIALNGGPSGIVFDNSGNLWAFYPWNGVNNYGELVKCTPPTGPCTIYGSGLFSNDGNNDQVAISKDNSGNIWVPDHINNQTLEFNTSGTHIATMPNNGNAANPYGSAFDASGNLWETNWNACQIVTQVNPSNGTILQTYGLTDCYGTGTNPVDFHGPMGIYITSR